MELRVALTVEDFDRALSFYRDALGLEQTADWSSEDGRVVLLGAARGTLELMDERQAALIDEVEAGRRVSGPVRLAVEVADSEKTARPRRGRRRPGRGAGDDALGRPQRPRPHPRRDAAHAVFGRVARSGPGV